MTETTEQQEFLDQLKKNIETKYDTIREHELDNSIRGRYHIGRN